MHIHPDYMDTWLPRGNPLVVATLVRAARMCLRIVTGPIIQGKGHRWKAKEGLCREEGGRNEREVMNKTRERVR